MYSITNMAQTCLHLLAHELKGYDLGEYLPDGVVPRCYLTISMDAHATAEKVRVAMDKMARTIAEDKKLTRLCKLKAAGMPDRFGVIAEIQNLRLLLYCSQDFSVTAGSQFTVHVAGD